MALHWAISLLAFCWNSVSLSTETNGRFSNFVFLFHEGQTIHVLRSVVGENVNLLTGNFGFHFFGELFNFRSGEVQESHIYGDVVVIGSFAYFPGLFLETIQHLQGNKWCFIENIQLKV